MYVYIGWLAIYVYVFSPCHELIELLSIYSREHAISVDIEVVSDTQ
jgi:hypothetical protein